MNILSFAFLSLKLIVIPPEFSGIDDLNFRYVVYDKQNKELYYNGSSDEKKLIHELTVSDSLSGDTLKLYSYLYGNNVRIYNCIEFSIKSDTSLILDKWEAYKLHVVVDTSLYSYDINKKSDFYLNFLLFQPCIEKNVSFVLNIRYPYQTDIFIDKRDNYLIDLRNNFERRQGWDFSADQVLLDDRLLGKGKGKEWFEVNLSQDTIGEHEIWITLKCDDPNYSPPRYLTRKELREYRRYKKRQARRKENTW